jgi:hypothetical protein
MLLLLHWTTVHISNSIGAAASCVKAGELAK